VTTQQPAAGTSLPGGARYYQVCCAIVALGLLIPVLAVFTGVRPDTFFTILEVGLGVCAIGLAGLGVAVLVQVRSGKTLLRWLVAVIVGLALIPAWLRPFLTMTNFAAHALGHGPPGAPGSP
jgi:hypothetical protein